MIRLSIILTFLMIIYYFILEEIKTYFCQDYKIQPLNFGTLHFNIKDARDAYIVLTDSLENKSHKYEVLLFFSIIIENT